MKKTLILTTAIVSLGFAANADVTVMSWGTEAGSRMRSPVSSDWHIAQVQRERSR